MNEYCTIDQLKSFYDVRSLVMLGNDDGGREINSTIFQNNLDACASELEAHLGAQIALPLDVVPMVLTRWVATKALERLYARRGDRPKSIEGDIEWANEFLEAWDAGSLYLGGSRHTKSLTFTDATAKQLSAGPRGLTIGLG